MMSYTKKEIITDVLVIGGGIAAVFAARRAASNGASVTMIDKGSIGRSGQTPFATAMATFDETTQDRDEWQRIMAENGENINNPAYLEVMMDYSKELYDELATWGATSVGFGGVIRTKMMEENIDIIERTMITTLLEDNGRVVGAVGFKLDDGETIVVKAKSVVLCTGAGGFKPNGFQVCSLTFDGDAMAYRIGAKIAGKEFIDTHFTYEETPAYCWGQWSGMWETALRNIPDGPMDGGGDALDLHMAIDAHQSGVAVSSSDGQQSGGGGAPSGESGSGEMPGGAPSGESGSGEMSGGAPSGESGSGEMSGGAPSGESGSGEMSSGAPSGESSGGEPPSGGGGGQSNSSSNRIVGASAGLSVHKAEGLFPADNKCRTNIEGLLAAGDCLSSMLVGAVYNGVGGFALAGSASQGALAGEVAAEYIKNIDLATVSDSVIDAAITEMYEPLNNTQGYSPGWVEHMLQGTLIPYYVLYVKEETRLNSALTNIEFFRDHFAVKLKADDLHGLRKAHEVKNMILNAEMKLRASLFRTESRGNHYREDYPDTNDEEWLAWVVMHKGEDGNMEMEKFMISDFEKLIV
jgi:succinate dehydrogenase/fumarate reductase flavoprotein subunit